MLFGKPCDGNTRITITGFDARNAGMWSHQAGPVDNKEQTSRAASDIVSGHPTDRIVGWYLRTFYHFARPKNLWLVFIFQP
ncbi:MAG TPA: hypothetical protein VFB27_06490 [Opitutaceae bacterium]|nr:hypothetical protein [Opitutaceae bacterium]